MLVTIGVADPEEADVLRDFYRWLQQEEVPPGEVRLVGERTPGAMGGGLEVVNVALTHSLSLANLALVYAGWRRARRPRGALTFTRASDGLSVTVEEGSEEAVRVTLQALADVDRDGDRDGSGNRGRVAPGAA
ncbi:hypothetical protein [Streptomyces sp. NPDC048603]|uniref:effector-associated constant component EACC1 n=1 Tax=Streptomyces sp. NPDC048603 TaxID=3365577 RepID=UPI003718AC35